MKKRLDYIDIAKALGIFMITYEHIMDLKTPVGVWMSLFKVAIFYVISGYMLALKGSWDQLTLPGYFRKMVRSLIIPYAWFSAIMIGTRLLAGYLKHNEVVPLLRQDLYATLTFRGISTMWFLPSLFIGEIVFFLILKSKSKVVFGLTFIWPIIVSIGFQSYLGSAKQIMSGDLFRQMSYPILTVSRGLLAVWFLAVGYLAYCLIKKLQNTTVKLLLGALFFSGTFSLVEISPTIDLNHMKIGVNPTVFFAGGVLGSVGAILLFMVFEKYFRFGIFQYFGKNSLILMAVQRNLMLISIAVAGFRSAFRIEETVGKRYYVETLTVFVIVLIMSYGVIEIINHYFPFMIGKKRVVKQSNV